MSDLKLVLPDGEAQQAEAPVPFIFTARTYIHSGTGRSLTERVVVSGVAPENFPRWATGVQTAIGTNGAGQTLMANGDWFCNAETIEEAFAQLDAEWDGIIKRIKEQGMGEVRRAQLTANIGAAPKLNGHNGFGGRFRND